LRYYVIKCVIIALLLKLVITYFQDNFSSEYVFVPTIIIRTLLILITFYIVIREKIMVKKYIFKNQILSLVVSFLIIYMAVSHSNSIILENNIKLNWISKYVFLLN